MFNDRLRAIRIARGYTLQRTADAIGVTLRSYQRYEGGSSEPSFDILIDLADLFSVSTDLLLCRDEYLNSIGIFIEPSFKEPPARHPKKKTSH